MPGIEYAYYPPHIEGVHNDGNTQDIVLLFQAQSVIIDNNTDQRCIVFDSYNNIYHADPFTVRAVVIHPTNDRFRAQLGAQAAYGSARVIFTDVKQAYVYGLQSQAHNKITYTLIDTSIKVLTIQRISPQLVIEFGATGGGAGADQFQVTYTPPSTTGNIILVTGLTIAPLSFPPPIVIPQLFAAGTQFNTNLQIFNFNLVVTLGY